MLWDPRILLKNWLDGGTKHEVLSVVCLSGCDFLVVVCRIYYILTLVTNMHCPKTHVVHSANTHFVGTMATCKNCIFM